MFFSKLRALDSGVSESWSLPVSGGRASSPPGLECLRIRSPARHIAAGLGLFVARKRLEDFSSCKIFVVFLRVFCKVAVCKVFLNSL